MTRHFCDICGREITRGPRTHTVALHTDLNGLHTVDRGVACSYPCMEEWVLKVMDGLNATCESPSKGGAQ